MSTRNFGCVAIGVSAGGLRALSILFGNLPEKFPLPIVVVQHEKSDSENLLSEILDRQSALSVKTAEEKEKLKGGVVYICPADYHLLIEEDKTLSLSADPKVNFARPSIDVLFDTAARAYGDQLLAVVLTGASSDGSSGLVKVMEYGGYSIVQDPETAYSSLMPASAIAACPGVNMILPLEEIASHLITLCMNGDFIDR